jgi:energy-coupling factor transport system permease protein
VNIAPRYLGRGSWLARRDPRTIILVVALIGVTVIQIWDIRIVLVMLAGAFVWYRSARIPFHMVRRQWIFVAVFVSFIVLWNTLLTSGEIGDFERDELHVLFTLPLLGTPISAEALSYGATQYARFFTFATLGFTMAYAIAPADLGVAFARLRVPEKFAYAIDMTFRFMPSLGNDLQDTMDAQRVRGHEWDRGKGGPIAKLRRTVPLVVPLTMNAIVNAEDTIDAMDLRAFGTGRRTWLRELVFDRTDRLILIGAVALLVTFTVLGFVGPTADLYVFPFLLDLAGA